MSRPTAIVTGASTGIGFCTARALARRGYLVVVATRDATSGESAARRINADASSYASSLADGEVAGGEAVFMKLDVSSLASVAAFSSAFIAQWGSSLHCLVLNAGIASRARGEPRMTADGFERIFATNFLGHFALAQGLLDMLKFNAIASPPGGAGTPVRIVTLGSVTHRLVRAPPSWPAVIEGRGPRGSQYALSKLAAVAFAFELQRRLVGTGVTAIAVNPGGVASDIWRHVTGYTRCALRPLMACAFLNTEQGSRTSVMAGALRVVDAAGHDVDVAAPAPVYLSPYAAPTWAQTGGFVALLFDLLGPFAGPRVLAPSALSLDPAVGAALFDACESALGRAKGM
jgi:NAD(P)-dependent dehydrogenase (short-subunit alcohol dehydrogenase family)